MNEYTNRKRDAQVASSLDTLAETAVENRLKEAHTMLPGIIVAFDPVSQTASVQPAIKRIFTQQGAVNLPLCVDVPVAFPGGGDFYLTFPVKPGDECILLFAERCIDGWHCDGGTAPPEDYRLHDLSDGIAIVGLNSLPKKIPVFNAADTELRTRAGDTHITMKQDGTIEAVNPQASITVKDDGSIEAVNPQGSFTLGAEGSMTLNAPAGTTINSPQITLNGNVVLIGGLISLPGNGGMGQCQFAGDVVTTGDVVAQGVSLAHHTHPGVQAGGGTTGQPTGGA